MKNRTLNNSVLKNIGMTILINNLGEVDAERFISLILEEPFDYTEWQKELFVNKSIEELSLEAMNYVKENSK